MSSRVRVLMALVVLLVALVIPAPAHAIELFDCKEAPTPELPGRGVGGFFASAPSELPPAEDPFVKGSSTTIHEQYGFAGLRWRTYDLGCGPDAMRHPDAVIGSTISNWIMQVPIVVTALTGSVTKVAFAPGFLTGLDESVAGVTTALQENFFVSWIPIVLAAVGALILVRARRASLATSTAAVGWAVLVILLATAIFRWPVESGRAADATVTGTLGSVASELIGHDEDVDPGTAVASGAHEAILYRAWLAGTFGSHDSRAAREYGPALFKSQALTWREAATVESDPRAGKRLIEQKQEDFGKLADKIKNEDPEAYEYLQGTRSETRVAYASLAAFGILLALPFLLMSSLLLLGCFLVVRLAVMLFPAFATIGAFPAARGLVIGLGRIVGAAVVNSIIFGAGAAITVAILGVLLNPGGGSPPWLGLVLMPVFTVVMWVVLKPFRRLTSMVSPDSQFIRPLDAPRWAGRTLRSGLVAATGGAAAGAVAAAVQEDAQENKRTERAEANPPMERPSTVVGHVAPQLASAPARQTQREDPTPPTPPSGPAAPPTGPTRRATSPAEHVSTPASAPDSPTPWVPSLEAAAPEEFGDEEVFVIYRPGDDRTGTDSEADQGREV